MAALTINLTNPNGLRLSVFRECARNIAAENEARDTATAEVNADPQHSRFGPWEARSSRFVTA